MVIKFGCFSPVFNVYGVVWSNSNPKIMAAKDFFSLAPPNWVTFLVILKNEIKPYQREREREGKKKPHICDLVQI